jgi:PleD family two-component response regulator
MPEPLSTQRVVPASALYASMKTALIAIEEGQTRRVLQNTLARQGWQVDAVDRVEGVLAFIDHSPPDVVLIEWEIGAGSGLALLRGRFRGADLEVVLGVKLCGVWLTVRWGQHIGWFGAEFTTGV